MVEGGGFRRRWEPGQVLMSRPLYRGLTHLLNPWMSWREELDVGRAVDQWEQLRELVEAAGARVEELPPLPESPALTFTRDLAVIHGEGRAIVLRNHGRRGDVEPGHVQSLLEGSGFSVELLDTEHRLDGGNVLPSAAGWLVGVPPGTGRGPADALADAIDGRPSPRTVGIPLSDHKYGHLDLGLADLAGVGWMLYPPALADPQLANPAWESLLGERPVIRVTDEEAESLACNVVVLNRTVIGGGLSPRLCELIAELGLDPAPCQLDEFRKAGGGAHCLILDLDPPYK